MLGYTLPYYDKLSPSDNKTYRRYYCEGCHHLREGFGVMGTLTVNYDMTFNTMILDGVMGDALDFGSTTGALCIYKKHKADSKMMDAMAAYTLILAKWELYDDDTDKLSVKSKFASLSLGRAIEKAVKEYPEYDRMVGEGFNALHQLELEGCKDAPLMGSTFGKGLIGALRDIAGKYASDDLDNLFLKLSTVVYLMDAIDDLDEDFMEGTYNPLLPEKGFVNASEFRLKNVYELSEMLNKEIGSLQESYSRIRPSMKGNVGICDNIVYYGIPGSAKKVMVGDSTSKLSVANLISNRKNRLSS